MEEIINTTLAGLGYGKSFISFALKLKGRHEDMKDMKDMKNK